MSPTLLAMLSDIVGLGESYWRRSGSPLGLVQANPLSEGRWHGARMKQVNGS
jgi:hypothetical protein